MHFKNENDANNEDNGEKETSVSDQKPESILVDRNQYNIGDTFTFEANREDIVPEVKDDGIDIR